MQRLSVWMLPSHLEYGCGMGGLSFVSCIELLQDEHSVAMYWYLACHMIFYFISLM